MLIESGRDPILQLPSKIIMSVKVEVIHSRFIVYTALLPTNGSLMRHPSRDPIHGWENHNIDDDPFFVRCHLWELRIPTLHAMALPFQNKRACGNLAMRLNVSVTYLL